MSSLNVWLDPIAIAKPWRNLAIGLTAHLIHDRRQRSAFIASRSTAERARLSGFEMVKGDWHEFRDLLHH
jgi:hypothetical protein